ncbi:hypothetical protein McanMca71_002997 [Microsporum canis]
MSHQASARLAFPKQKFVLGPLALVPLKLGSLHVASRRSKNRTKHVTLVLVTHVERRRGTYLRQKKISEEDDEDEDGKDEEEREEKEERGKDVLAGEEPEMMKQRGRENMTQIFRARWMMM